MMKGATRQGKRNNARIGALKRWCPACDRKMALNAVGVCRWCGTRHAMTDAARRERYLTIKNKAEAQS